MEDEKIEISDVFKDCDVIFLNKLKKIDKIARNSKFWYYTGFGLPLDNNERIIKHKDEIQKMIDVLKK